MGKKLIIEIIKQSFENEGYKLLTKEYNNAHQYLNFICPNGHKHKITWNNWQQKYRCGFCSGRYNVTHKQIKQSFEKEGYQLLSKEYKNCGEYLNYICPNGHKHKITWSSWKQKVRCGKCKGNIEVTYKQVKQSFNQEGYTLLTKQYKNCKQYLNYICPNGHKHKISWNNWKQGKGCPKCFLKWSKQEKEIVNYVKDNYNGTIIENDRTLIKNPKTGQHLELDIYLPELNKAIEYNGKYWHKDKYSQWKDNYKKRYCKENNIDLLVIQDEEWIKNKDFNIINNFIEV